jgi:serine/threonine-protein kinase
MIGQTISHYRIVEKLGEGGMGVVYKAEDLQLKRIVALKFLPKRLSVHGEERERFMLEAQSASALNHPNICIIYAIGEQDGETFIVMEYLDGVTLRQWIRERAGQPDGYRRLGVKESIDLAVQIGEGLGKAHEKGIIHRDIKSENVMVTVDGRAKIMDFGLAKLGNVSKLTKTGSTIGTISYMSPEQVEGIETDHRTDIFSFGVLLYETLTGQLPFRAEHDTAIMYEIINVEPKPVTEVRGSLDAELNRIVMKCLEKDREIRYQSMKDVVVDLQRYRRDSSGKRLDGSAVTAGSARASTLSAPPRSRKLALPAGAAALILLAAAAWYLYSTRTTPIDSLAVLPFVNTTTDPNTEYLSDGITENVINKLSQLSKLRVIPRSLVARYKGKDTDPRDVGKDLNVGAVLTGKVVQRGNSLSIQTELIDVKNVSQLWGEQYNRTLADIITVQQDIAEKVAEKLQTQLSGEERTHLTARHTTNPEAYQMYLQGRFYWNKRTSEGVAKGLDYFQRAVELDPAFALGHVGIADCYAVGLMGGLTRAESNGRLKVAATRALELDESLAEPHAALATEIAYYEYDFAGAEKEFRRSIELNPTYPTVHHWFAEFLVFMGRFEEGLSEYRRATELDPLSLAIASDYGLGLYFSRQYDRSIEQLKKTIEMDPNFIRSHDYIVGPYYQKGMYDAAFAEIIQGMVVRGDSAALIEKAKRIYASSGFKGMAQFDLDRSIKNPNGPLAFNLAIDYLQLGRKDDALAELEKAYTERQPTMVALKVEPAWDGIRNDPRFQALMKKVGLEK